MVTKDGGKGARSWTQVPWPDSMASYLPLAHPRVPLFEHGPGALTMSTWPQIIRLRFLVKVPTKSTKAGRKLGGPVSTRHWGL